MFLVPANCVPFPQPCPVCTTEPESPPANRFYNGCILDRNKEKTESTTASLSLRWLAPVSQSHGSAPLLVPAFLAFASAGAVCSFSKLRALCALLTAFETRNSFAFKRFRPLAQKTPGGGGARRFARLPFRSGKNRPPACVIMDFQQKNTFLYRSNR